MHDNGIEELITKLYDMVQDARSLPLGADKCIVERTRSWICWMRSATSSPGS